MSDSEIRSIRLVGTIVFIVDVVEGGHGRALSGIQRVKCSLDAEDRIVTRRADVTEPSVQGRSRKGADVSSRRWTKQGWLVPWWTVVRVGQLDEQEPMLRELLERLTEVDEGPDESDDGTRGRGRGRSTDAGSGLT